MKEKITEWIEGIIEDLVSENIHIEDTLRKTKVLAFRIENESLKQWVDSELNGFTNQDSVPDYRIIPSEIKGDLIQQNFSQIIGKRDIRLPIEYLEEEYKKSLQFFNLTQSVAEINSLINAKETDYLIVNLPYAVNSKMQKFIKNYQIEKSWREIQKGSLIGVISNLKNYLLNFLLELNKEIGSEKDFDILKKKKAMDEIFNRTIGSVSGQNINISIGSNNIQSSNSEGSTSTIQQSINSYPDDKIRDDLKELLEIFRKLEKDSENEIEDAEEVKNEVSRLEIQSKKDQPKRKIIKQSLEILKTMAINISSNSMTEPLIYKITEMMKYLG